MNQEQEMQNPEAQACAPSTQAPQAEQEQPKKWWQKILADIKSKDKPFYKKKSFLLAFAVVAVVFVLILICSSDPVQDDLIDYWNNDMQEMAELEEEALALYEEARTSPNDYTFYTMLDEQVLPKAKEWAEAAEVITPETEEVKELHEHYITYTNEMYSAFTMMMAALEEQDYALVTQANEKIDAAKKAGREYTSALKSLMEEHDVEEIDG